jgi:hypothetical protein
MKKILLYTLLILTFNLTILIIPLLVFLISLSVPGVSIFDTFRWFYFPMILFSPILILILCYRIARRQIQRPWIAMFIAFIGFSPIWLAYMFLTSPWNWRDLGIVLLSPLFLSFIAIALAKYNNKFPQ